MNNNPSYKSCVNKSPSRSPTREHNVPMPLPCGELGSPAFQIEEQLNTVYEKRLSEINEQTGGNAALKEVTYVEWIAMLRQINKTLITNIQEMEHETTERLELLQRKVNMNCRYGQESDACKCRNDIAGLIQLIRNGRQNGDWSVDRFNFETITKHDIFGNDTSCCESPIKYETECSQQSNTTDLRSCAGQKSKLTANVKALAFEVADKHDEIRDLKKQILSMEDEIQKAQKKIQLKDDVIRELRNDLKSLPKCPAVCGAKTSDRTAPNHCYLPMSEQKSSDSFRMELAPASISDGSYSNRDSINSMHGNSMDGILRINIPDDEDEEEEFVRCLKEELNQLFDIRRNYDQSVVDHGRALKDRQNRLSDMVDKLLKSNNDLHNKLRFYRHELLNLENPQSSRTLTVCSDVDSGISSESEPDVKIINSVRNRIVSLVDDNCRLKKQHQCMVIKFEDVNSKAIAKSDILEKTSKALRQVADTLSNAICKPISYDTIFAECPNMSGNPIVDAVIELVEDLQERNKMIEELRKQMANHGQINQELECKSKELRAELCELKQSMSRQSQNENHAMLLQNQDFSKSLLKQAEKYQEENSGTQQENHSEYLSIIDDLSSELNTLSHQVNMVQKDFLNDEVAKQFESSLKGLETQNDLLQAAVESLIEEREAIERTLQTQNEDLKSRLSSQEETICTLRNQIIQMQQRPCERCTMRAQSECTQRDFRRGTPRTDSDEELKKLESELRRKNSNVNCLQSENARLSEELAEIRKSQAKLKLLQRRGASGVNGCGANQDQEIIAKLNAAQEKNQQQCKSLQKANKEIASLRQEIEMVRANEEAFSKERDLLQTELIALKESQATQMGAKQSLQEQLQGAISELYTAKKKLQECMQVEERIKNAHRCEAKRFQDLQADLLEKYNNLVESYNELTIEYQKVVEIEQEKTKQIRAFNTWKNEQIQVESEVRKKLQLLESHIKQMLEDKNNLLELLTETENDNRTLVQAMEQSKVRSMGVQRMSACSPSRGYNVVAASSSTDPVSKVIENVRHTSRRLSQQRCLLEDEASQYFSK